MQSYDGYVRALTDKNSYRQRKKLMFILKVIYYLLHLDCKMLFESNQCKRRNHFISLLDLKARLIDNPLFFAHDPSLTGTQVRIRFNI